jgi:outer membrane protein assembly factor BamB
MQCTAAIRVLIVVVGLLTRVADGWGAEAVPANEQADALVARVLSALGRPVGLAHLPRCKDAGQALALARAGKWTYVHGQHADPAAVAGVRRAVDDAGLLNRRISIDQGDLQRLLPVARSCDLVLLTDLSAEELSPALAAEIQRVLHPWYGVAVLGDASGKLSAAALLDWAKGISPTIAPLPGGGALVTVKAGPLAGADDWTHWWHGPDNNAVSTDKAYTLPETVQWAGKPFFAGTRVELPIVAGGRLFMLWNGHEMDMSGGAPLLAGEEGKGPLLTAQAVGSGQMLWVRRLSPAAWVQVSRSIVVADGEHLLVADGNRIVELDAATGGEKRHAQLDCPEIKWMALHAGRLLVLGGTATRNRGRRSAEAVVPFRSSGLHLIALDRKAFEPLWRLDRQQAEDAFDPRCPAVAGDRVFLCTETGTAEAYSAEDGKPLWKVAVGFDRMKIQEYEWDRSSRHPVTGYAMLGVYVISATEMPEAVVLSQADGKRLWSTPTPQSYMLVPLAFEGLLWKEGHGLDAATGKVKRSLGGVNQGGCSRFTACPQGIVGNAGLTYDLLAAKPVPVLSAKSLCGAGQFVANGLAWKFPTPCTNCTEWRGFIARGPAEKPPPAQDRIVRSADCATTSEADPAGWLTYRGNAARSASTPARIARATAIAWTAPPAHPAGPVSQGGAVMFDSEMPPTPPIVAGRVVIVAGGDGAVDALDLESGRRLWRARTGGRINSSPSAWRDRLFVGSEDGFVYALALADGRELWRLRVAPRAGRTMVYGQSGSRWPVLGCPTVLGGRVYATAGLLDGVDGVFAIAADAATGNVLWQRDNWQDGEVDGLVSGAGQFCTDATTLIYHGAESPPVRLGIEDGKARVTYAEGHLKAMVGYDVRKWRTVQASVSTYRDAKGQDVGTLSPGWLIFGGRRLFADQAESGTWGQALSLLVPDETGNARLPVLKAVGCERMPSWDEQDVLLTVTTDKPRFYGLVLVKQSDLRAAARKAMPDLSTAEILAKDGTYKNGMSIPPDEIVRPLSELPGQWRKPIAYGWSAVATALGPDAAVVCLVHHSGKARLVAHDRADGGDLWALELPDAPVHSGLAIAADGRIVVALRDGRVLCVANRDQAPK